jgi:hypothetical protein
MLVSKKSFCLVAVVLSAIAFPLQAQTAGKHRVELEIAADPGEGVDTNQRWLEVLEESGADNIRMTQGREASKPGVRETEGSSGKTIIITGVLRNNQLHLPAGRFGFRDIAKIREYVVSLQADGAEVALADKVAFGLTDRQLVELHDDLARPLEFSTIGKRAEEVLRAADPGITTPIRVTPAAEVALRDEYVLQDEFQGLSHGTSLAAALRTVGLVLVPVRQQGQPVEIHVVPSSSAAEFWPIGWPLQQQLAHAAPKVFERIPVNIENFSLDKTLPAVQKMLGMPFLYDYNSLAEKEYDLAAHRVTIKSERLSFQGIVSQIATQSRGLQYEFRADEAGKVFLWFSAR